MSGFKGIKATAKSTVFKFTDDSTIDKWIRIKMLLLLLALHLVNGPILNFPFTIFSPAIKCGKTFWILNHVDLIFYVVCIFHFTWLVWTCIFNTIFYIFTLKALGHCWKHRLHMMICLILWYGFSFCLLSSLFCLRFCYLHQFFSFWRFGGGFHFISRCCMLDVERIICFG